MKDLLKQALDALEGPIYGAPVFGKPVQDAMKALRAAIEQGESEPVAWMDKQQGAFSFMGGKYGPTWTPLYAAPQVDDYVPLSDEQWQALQDETGEIWSSFTRNAIEHAVRGVK